MREVKFRAWHKEKRVLVRVIDLYLSDGTVHLPIETDVTDGCWWDSTTWDLKDVELMQYTGLKDKNGKEIYEGDILEGFGREDFRMQVLFKEPSFSVKWFDKSIKSIRQLPDGIEPIPHNINITSEVIGNIYENPELHSPNKLRKEDKK